MTSIRNLVLESQAGYDSRTVVTVPRDAQQQSEIPDELLQALKMNVVTRQVAAGFALLDSHRQLLETLEPLERNAASLAGYVAQWIDIGYSDPELLEKLLLRFPPQVRGQLPVAGYLHLRMAEGLLALLRDHTDAALRHFDFVLSLRDEIQDQEMLAIVHFWNARCHRRKGEYDEALKQCGRGYELAQTAGWPRMAAVMQVLEAWLMFQKGNRRAASQILDKAEAVLRHTDDDITLGNIYSAHGRMIRRQGSYKDSLRFFSKAIDHFRKRNPQHRNLARSLANIAYVQRLIAREISKEIDAEAERRRKSHAKGKPAATRGRKEDHWAEYEQVRATAFADLEQAEKIYRHHNHHHGIGNVKENRGLLYLDIGDLDNASEQAAQAYELGKEENDSILMARARLLQCEVENARLEEEIEGSSHTWEHAQVARDYAREAVEWAKHTQYQRLLARAYIWRGLTACHPAINDREDARHCCERAESFLKSVQYDDLWQELQELKQKVLPKGSIDPRLRAWSAGETDGKTFQELAEQFAEVVIPRVWEKEGKKVSRVAKKLSVSPKKVRRVLALAGKAKKKKS